MKAKIFLSKLWEDERGQSTTEYILILSVVVMVAVKFKGMISKKLETMTNTIGDKMDEAARE